MDTDSAAPPQRVLESFDRNAAASEGNSEYLQSVSSESSSFIMVQPKNRLEVPSRLWVTTVVVIVIVLQVASTTGLFIYLNVSVAQARTQGVVEELRCLGLLNALEKEQEVPDDLVQLFGEPCIKLAEGLKAYISKVTETIISKHTFEERVTIPPRTKLLTAGSRRPSAHLTLRDSGLQVQNFDTEAIVSPIPEMPQKPLAKKKTSNKREEIQKKVTEMSAGFILFLIHVI
ncbi:hypothetical protein cypCar_00043330 [Cyprinus carpio]|nr:hypothetical protein cypCar_00043330 [Cyprinus carpio]